MILIVGAGIAGLSLGWELVKSGAEVTIVDIGEVAGGASGIATSYLEPRLGKTQMRRLEWDLHNHIEATGRVPVEWHDIAKERGAQPKVRTTLRVDADVVRFFKSM